MCPAEGWSNAEMGSADPIQGRRPPQSKGTLPLVSPRNHKRAGANPSSPSRKSGLGKGIGYGRDLGRYSCSPSFLNTVPLFHSVPALLSPSCLPPLPHCFTGILPFLADTVLLLVQVAPCASVLPQLIFCNSMHECPTGGDRDCHK